MKWSCWQNSCHKSRFSNSYRNSSASHETLNQVQDNELLFELLFLDPFPIKGLNHVNDIFS